jgi:hypothetical protein
MKVQADSFDEYFVKGEDREPDLREIDRVIKQAAPHLKPVLFKGMASGGAMLGYGLQPYQTKSMKEPEQWPIIALANQKNHISLYLSAVEDGEYIAEKNADRLGKVSCGKSCIRFTKFDDLNVDVVKEIISNIDKRITAGEKLFGL